MSAWDKVKPEPFDAFAKDMEPRAKAGVLLSKLVLGIVAASIVVLIGTLLVLNSTTSDDVRGAYAQIAPSSRVGSEFRALSQLDVLRENFNAAIQDPAWRLVGPAQENAIQVAAFLAKLPGFAPAQKAELDRCIAMPSGDDRAVLLQRCIGVLEAVRQAALQAASHASDAQTAAEAVDKLIAHRQSLFTFWIQAAQLVLLNLLLPLLTALFGYIFGSQQADRGT